MKQKQLKRWLLSNALFSTLNGLLMIVFHPWFQQQFGLSQKGFFISLGLGLLLFAGFLTWIIKKRSTNSKLIYSVCLMDLGWVLGSAILVLMRPEGMNSIAYGLVVTDAIPVALFGVQQFRAIRKS